MRTWWGAIVAGGALVSVVLNTSACRGSSADPGSVMDANRQVAVQVENHNWSDVVVYLVGGGQRRRLGLVTALNAATFSFPYRHLGTGAHVQLRADPIGGQSPYTSEDVHLQPGQGIKWTLEVNLGRSSLSVY